MTETHPLGSRQEKRSFYRRALRIHPVQIIRRVADALAAVAANGGGDTLTEHGVLDGLLLVGINAAVGEDGILMHMNIDKARADDLSLSLDDKIGVGRFRINGRHLAVGKEEIVDGINGIGGVDHSSAANQYVHGFLLFFQHIIQQPLRLSYHTFIYANCKGKVSRPKKFR